MKGYKRSLQTLVTMALKQATGVPTGNHGLFHRFGIEALTIEGVRQKSKRRQVVGLHTVGRVVEGIFRSLNNLLERFHQSFFFYLLPSSNRYVSIGMYMPAFGFLGGALVIAALGMWFQCAREEQFDRAKEAKKAQKAKNCHDEIVSLPVVIPSSVANVLPVIVFAHVIGYLMTVLPNRITKVGAHFRLETDDALAIFVFTYFILTLFLPASLGRAIVVDAKNWRVLKCITLLELAAVAFVVSLSNFSLAYIVCLIYVPFALLAGDNRDGGSSIVWFAKCSFSLLSHPMAMLAVVSTVDTIVNFPDKPLGKLVFMSVDATKRALTYAITDGMIYGNANYVMACVFLVPCWYLLWCQNFVTMENDQNTKEEITTEEDKKTK
jgi:glycosylphosphatidylinositol transamidase